MVYQGSKNRISKYLLPIIHKYIEENNINTYVELFCGGCNLIDKVKCKNKIACDYNEDLIALLKYAKYDTELSIAHQIVLLNIIKRLEKIENIKCTHKNIVL